MARRPAADRDDRRTPPWFFGQCERRYGRFDLDAAASADNALCRLWIGRERNGLVVVWAQEARAVRQVWCNPPYGPPGTIERWIDKARLERDRYALRTLLLLPADTSTRWYHDVVRTEQIELVKFRLGFAAPDGSTGGNSAKFGSALVYIAPQIVQPVVKRVAA